MKTCVCMCQIALNNFIKIEYVEFLILFMTFDKHQSPGMKKLISIYHNMKWRKSHLIDNMHYWFIDSKYAIVLLYVDDLLLVGDNHDELYKIKSIFTIEFDMTILDYAKLYLGAEFEQPDTIIYLHHLSIKLHWCRRFCYNFYTKSSAKFNLI